ncbi:unnamed protein product [Polarella glacialis]|uniref:Uncharacterized protein n=1 Tax=Polarella glacialis TaxID=89957 RepID=A0A813H3U1_POLGL|nr:unnamed protein product [Polarella glacialis]
MPRADTLGDGQASEDACPGESWVQTRIAEQLAGWQQTGITEDMFQATVHYLPSTGARAIEFFRNGTVHGTGGWADYLRRVAQAWPFERDELRDFKVVYFQGDLPMLVKDDPKAAPGISAPAIANANNGHFHELTMPV